MIDICRDVIADAERAAADGALPALRELRRLGLDDFAQVIIRLPDPALPNLSSALPRMAPEAIQKEYTGTADLRIHHQTLAFVWMLRARFTELTGRPLTGKKVLDFGCGYGRIIRPMYYFTDPANIYGVDAWQTPLDCCRDCGVSANFSQTTDIAGRLDVPDESISLAYSFSVFTHLSMEAMLAAFAAMRPAMKPDGVLIATVRPVEYWAFLDQLKSRSVASQFEAEHHKNGFAIDLDPRSKTYGDSSVSLAVLISIPDWKVVSWDRSMHDPMQVAVAFHPA